MKIFQNTTHYDYDWEHVSTANWQKYSPWNEKTPHVKAVDTLSRHVDPASGVVSTQLTDASKSVISILIPTIVANGKIDNVRTNMSEMVECFPRLIGYLTRLRMLLRRPSQENSHTL